MITTLLGFATALVYGFADFFGAIAARKINAVLVTFLSGLTGLLFLISMIPIFGARFDSATLFWGIGAGAASAFAMTCLYASLAIGPISILSPLGAVVSAVFPAAVGFVLGDRFSWVGWVALGLILIAVVFVGFIPGEKVARPTARGLAFGIAAGMGIGLVLICLNQAPSNSGIGAILLLRAVSAGILGLLVLVRWLRVSKTKVDSASNGIKTPKLLWLSVGVAGIFDASANLFFLIASRTPHASLTVVSVLTALYPLGTIILSRVFLHERIAKIQQLGILLALIGSALLAAA